MVTQLLTRADRARARVFIEAQGLAFEPELDDLVGAFEEGALVAAGARAGDVLKMIAIDPAHQSGALLGELAGELVRLGLAAGHDGLFVFTRPDHAPSFERLNFALLARHAKVALLEIGGRFEAWLAAGLRAAGRETRPGDAAAVVLNANPFTLGHRHLVEQAARRAGTLHVFVVREDRSAFPFEVRLRLVREGTADLRNVVVLDTSRYAVSAVTFPAYFLGRADPVAEIQMELDATLFGARIAPAFGVTRRFLGTEPTCATTRAYNAAMRGVLPALGVEVVELERARVGGLATAPAISASTVRAALAAGDLGALPALVPPTTLAYLLSGEGRALRGRLGGAKGRHG
jgi:[citrate (pro-3S)-lyase] ligase